jgi:hypothetical protein
MRAVRYNVETLSALISMSREAGDSKSALVYAKKAAEILPNDADLKRLVGELDAKR